MVTVLPETHSVGTALDEVDTPALYLDLDRLEANIRRMAEYCAAAGVAWRPHAKGHKCPQLAALEIEAGAIGLTCAKLAEAEVMAAAGIEDLLVANQLVGRAKLDRLMALRRVADPILTVDHPAHIAAAGEAARAAGVELRTIIEVDIGLARAGVPPGEPTLELAQAIDRQPGLRLVGLMGYEGHLLALPDPADKRRQIEAAIAPLIASRDLLLRSGLCCDIVSAGGTGSYAITAHLPGITELQAGGLVMMDAYYRHVCNVTGFDHALKLVTTVVSRPVPDRAIVDAGRKALNGELIMPEVEGRPGLRFSKLSAEHGWLDVEPQEQGLALGERLHVIPGYSDFTAVLHDHFLAVRGGRVEAIWPLAARGRLT
ncbi:MAG: DSD1 family PLP-dependent enzyme [Pirellulales bacterium]|nr:DSD1 family PLP-dependent enzyme [Pirellulales bacterium]